MDVYSFNTSCFETIRKTIHFVTQRLIDFLIYRFDSVSERANEMFFELLSCKV